jgi:hypothetical protein
MQPSAKAADNGGCGPPQPTLAKFLNTSARLLFRVAGSRMSPREAYGSETFRNRQSGRSIKIENPATGITTLERPRGEGAGLIAITSLRNGSASTYRFPRSTSIGAAVSGRESRRFGLKTGSRICLQSANASLSARPII